MTDAAAQLNEQATYCAPDDEKRPDIVGLPDFTLQRICDDDLAVGADMITNAYPDGWYIRIVFDELLDPNIEELIEILDPDTGEGTDTYTGSLANTQPVTLECESVGGGFVAVSYDGYYSPSGNRLTWPLGPSLVIKPNDPTEVATTKTCRVTIKETVVDKSGEAVPADQRGPFEFKLAPITPIFVDPSDGAEVDALQIYYDNMYVQFNTEPDPDSLCTDVEAGGPDGLCDSPASSAFAFSPDPGGICAQSGNPCMTNAECTFTTDPTDTCETAYAYSLAPYGFTPTEFGIGPANPLETDTEYTFSLREGGMITDRCGVVTTLGAPSVAGQSEVTFTTAKFALKSISPGTGDTTPPLKKPVIQFNNVLEDPTALVLGTDYTITPAPGTPSVNGVPGSGGEFVMYGHYQPNTMYTLTLRAGTVIKDAYAVPYANTTDRVVTWTTSPIALTGTSPADGATSLKATPTSLTTIKISFNQSMNPATLDAGDYTMSGGATFSAATATGCGPTSTTCTLNLTTTATLAPDDYTFTLKAGAQIADALGNNFAQAADRVINFTVENATTPPVHICL